MKYIIVPDASDYNRGDQALVWESIRLFQDAGFYGDFYIQADELSAKQSVEKGYHCFSPLLPHPSRNKRTDNVNYNSSVLIRWGATALWDLLRSLFLLLIANHPSLYFMLSQKTKSSVSVFKNSDALIVKGGGFLQSYGGMTAPYFVYFHLYSIFFANRIDLPVYIMPNSFGPLDGVTVKWQVRKALSKCKLIYCRESISYDYMKHHFGNIEFKKTFDLGFYIAAKTPVEQYNLWPDRKKVAITVRPYRFPEHSNGSEFYKQYINSMVSLTKSIIEKGLFPVFVQHVRAVNTHEDDMTAISDIISHLPVGQYAVFSDESFDCQQMKSIYSFFDYIVGTRFHSVIFSLASYVPALSIAYGGNKSRGIMRDIGLEKFVVNIDEVTSDNLVELFDKLVSETDSVKTSLKKTMSIISKERDTIINDIKESNRV